MCSGVQPLHAHTQFNADSGTTTTGPDGDGSAWLPAGSIFYAHSLSRDLKIGVGILGYFGLGLEYEDDWLGRYYVQEVTLQALGFQPAVAYRVADWLSVGAGVVALYGVLDEKVAINNIDPNRGDGRLKIHAEDTTSLTADRNYKDTWHAAFGVQYRVSDPWLLSAGISYDSSMVDDKDRTPDMPLGEQWRFGLGARYDWSQQLAFGLAYELLWGGNLDMDLNRGPLAGRVEGSYEDAAIHFICFNVNWKF